MSEKFEFASEQWVDVARETLQNLSAGEEFGDLEISFCEEFTDPPENLSPTGESIGWYLKIANGELEVSAGVLKEADMKVIADYATVLPLARATHAEMAANPPDVAALAGKMTREGDPSKMAALTWMGQLHDLLAARTI